MSKLIPLSQGEFAIVDDADYGAVSSIRWRLNRSSKSKYAICGNGTYMHRYISDAETGMSIDHINGNGLDNRRKNLRVCSHKQNLCNREKNHNNTSGYKGVVISRGKYIVSEIKHNGVKIRMYGFKTKEQAALAYDKKATELFGEFAMTNKMLGLL